jgi:hypothetical protein
MQQKLRFKNPVYLVDNGIMMAVVAIVHRTNSHFLQLLVLGGCYLSVIKKLNIS